MGTLICHWLQDLAALRRLIHSQVEVARGRLLGREHQQTLDVTTIETMIDKMYPENKRPQFTPCGNSIPFLFADEIMPL